MSCKHEFVEAQGTKMDYEKNDNGRIETLIRRKVCWKCYKTKTEIDLEQQLAAANARIAELTEKEEQFAEIKAKNATLELASIKQHKYVGRLNDEITGLYARLRIEIERAEQAEAQCVYWENKYKEITNG